MNACTLFTSEVSMGEPQQPDPSSAEPPEPTSGGHQATATLLVHNHSSIALDLSWLRQHVLAALPMLTRPVQRVDVLIVSDAVMIDMHQRYHKLNTTTDVLTFDASLGTHGPIEVDIAICADVASRQSTQRQHTIEQELLLYVIHGLLHCCGYDDHDDAAFAAMHAEEDRILQAIGVGRTFDTNHAATTQPLRKQKGQHG
jgi:probable rRNA maturation factor